MPFHQKKIVSGLAVFDFRCRGDLPQDLPVLPGRRPEKADGLFFHPERSLFDVIHAKRHRIGFLIAEMRHPIQPGLFMRVFDQDRRAASPSQHLDAVPFVLQDFGGGISFIPQIEEFGRSFF